MAEKQELERCSCGVIHRDVVERVKTGLPAEDMEYLLWMFVSIHSCDLPFIMSV